jgi:flagellar basal-body rod protein FlgG
MAITALHTASTGLKALSTGIDVVANNLANAETTAFKRSRVNFEDLIYQTKRAPGSINGDGDVDPMGIHIGLGTRVSNTQADFEQGGLEGTDRQLDVAIQGEGFFRVQVLDSVGDGTAYTRSGNLIRTPDGDLVLGIGSGYKLVPPVTVPTDADPSSISISRDGEVTAVLPGDPSPQVVATIELARFPNPHGLSQLGGSIYVETEASGAPIQNRPGEGGTGQLISGHLEGSNVDPVRELVTLIKLQRSFELNSQSIQTADQVLQTVGQLRR